ncbi:hypothetical protein V493_01258 [Pseudogymnoascus sp. VKM F-4281 (FW-2241)]|nr:hypothetical protein V493_01258 [Pseudogymnoascus sp. VKM F-4281 (FW-2241)]
MPSNNKDPGRAARLSDARLFFLDQPDTYTITWVARKFNVNRETLRRHIEAPPRSRGGQNRILSQEQDTAICQFIYDQLERGVPANQSMILRAVADLRPDRAIPSQRWLQRFLKAHPEFHSIHTKTLNTHRKQAQKKEVFEEFFFAYNALIAKHNIKPYNLWNVDETGYMIGCYKSTAVIVPTTVKQWTVDNPENRLSVTVIEGVNASGAALAEAIIIPAKLHMESWYNNNLEPNALVIVNESGYSNDDIAIQYLIHFIQLSAEYIAPDDTRLLVVDGHESHKTERFLTLAEEHNIIICCLPAHTTHLLQPLDVAVFKQCKHFHQKALDQAVRSYDYEYKLRTFLSDLPQIRQRSLTVHTIQSGWRNAGLYPYNPPLVIDKIQETWNQTPEYELPSSYDFISTPKTSMQVVEAVEHWQQRAEAVFSSPSMQRFHSYVRGTKVVLHRGDLYKTELNIVTLRSAEKQ